MYYTREINDVVFGAIFPDNIIEKALDTFS